MESLKRPRLRMLYLVGGAGNAERVDVSELFGEHLASFGYHVDYVIFRREVGPAWRRERGTTGDTYVVGRSRRTGFAGAIANKVNEAGADIRTFLLALTGAYDIIQIRDKFVSALLGLLAARLRGRKFIYWLSYPYAECRILDAREGRARMPVVSLLGGTLARWLLYRVIMPYADHVFVQSDQMLRDVSAEGVPARLMTPVPMGVDAKLTEPRKAAVEPDTIVYLGTLLRVRRLEMLLDALKQLNRRRPNARLIFVGDGESPDDRHALEQRAQELGLTDAVEFTGMLPMADAHDRVAHAAVCVSPFFPTPILLSTSPTKLIEYMALGRPVVANDHPEQSRIIAASGCGLCVAWSAEAFAEALSQVLDTPEVGEMMGARGRTWVAQHRTYGTIARQVAAVYAQVVPPSACTGVPA